MIGGFVMVLGITFLSPKSDGNVAVHRPGRHREAHPGAEPSTAPPSSIEDRLAAIESRLPNQP
jgi:hypothetical protein